MFEFKTEIAIVYIHFILLIAGSNLNVFKCTQPAKVVWETCITSPGIALAGNRYQQELTGRSVSAVMYINHDIIPVRSSVFFLSKLASKGRGFIYVLCSFVTGAWWLSCTGKLGMLLYCLDTLPV